MSVELDATTYVHAKPTTAHSYILPTVFDVLGNHLDGSAQNDVFDLGCGTGGAAAALAEKGYSVVGVDPSSDGINKAKINYPELPLNVGSAYDDLSKEYGTFDAVISLEVVEHVYDPKTFTSTMYDLVKPGGIAVMSTPYHGYLKNLALAAVGKMDDHFMPLRDHGHIKFWSKSTLSTLLLDTGFDNIHFEYVGRIPAFAKSMIAVAQKPA
ncbi:2-polyprenyl-6-hydroxyphenyl methylase/3-demethylubiquinone-9 3-methyltransferase [Rhizobium pisi]|uniref:2-polyprenyl-6-hydroxyphenyl methylase/3-demethylubiquinone-9 3-methyltransferase n=2 Tax=Rhizobium TaxID=379 RepID=A0A7W6B7Z1_9HYPH|nr:MULTISPECIES: methyltransferase domain-containing protein [Rhizobium]MBB3134271.1 2-polyprenyl-6-hydroxyphenyl methylase/3-demethylubiquinone-9 3-methyltransferase [Rhizobium pisi]MBB3917397.1 2-polyprenyl-6-hydroxyphenyl methylase/3-demethylubiquinone-9 3-methyltransferase [Rhizobium fabae]RSB79796.1 methyltransferase domain-containing protein [Rhizobium pisi]RUM10148.1 methyltransferase domain-containing protein [Rhizobium fabae]TCA60465.1 methyltransferase domain-containing protein [Rhiz